VGGVGVGEHARAAHQIRQRHRSTWDIGAVFDREAAIFSCKVTAVFGLVLVVVGVPLALLGRIPRGWPTLGAATAVVGVTLVVLSGLAALLLRRD
jgi:hypothetical protein